jgi:hypothetical protein
MRETMDVCEIKAAGIFGQGIVNGRLVTEFKAGTLVCEPVEHPTEDSYGDSVSRFGVQFWCRGVFTPRCGYYCSEDVGHVDHVAR